MTTPRDQNQGTLCPKLWGQLPDDLIAFTFKKLPATDRIGLRALNKEWMTRITSSEFPPLSCGQLHSDLLLFAEDRLIVYKTKSNSWHQKSLQELIPSSTCESSDARVKPSKLELIASDGSFLCFSTPDYEYFVVCNPVTKQLIHLRIPDKPLEASSPPTGDPQHLGYRVDIFASQGLRRACSSGQVLGGLRVDSASGHFKLLTATLGGGSPLRTKIYSSQSKSWKQVNDFPSSIEDPHHNRRLSIDFGSKLRNATGGCVVCHDKFYTLVQHKEVFWELFRFDIRRELWSTVPVRRRIQFHLQLAVCEGNLLLVETPWYSRYSFFVIQESDGEVTSWISVLQPLTRQLESIFSRLPKEFRGTCCLSCISSGGDTVYLLNQDYNAKLLGYKTRAAKPLKLLVYNMYTQLLVCIEVGKNVMHLNLAESKCCTLRPSLDLLSF